MSSNASTFQRRAVRIAAVVCAALIGAFEHSSPGKRPADTFARRLVDAAPELTRPFAGRLSAFYPHIHRASIGRGTEAPQTAEALLALRMAATGIDARSLTWLQHAAAMHLLGGESRSAVLKLRAAAALPTAEANVWNDLSVALLASCDDFDVLLECLDALVAANTALARGAHAGTAHFNRALALERLGLIDDARREWDIALREEVDSDWRQETEEHAARLQARDRDWARDRARLEAAVARQDHALVRALVTEYPRDSRAWGEGVYLAQWADAVLAGDEAAANSALEIARAVGESLRVSSGESVLSDTVRKIAEQTSGNRQQTQDAARAYLRYREGRQQHAAFHPGAAIPLLEASRELFARVGSPMEFVAAYYTASADYAANDVDSAAERLDALAAAQFERRGYLALSAQIGWERGLCRLVRGEFSDAVDVLERSASQFAALGEDENRAAIEDFLAEVHEFTGNTAEAWKVRARALARLGDERRLGSLGTAATAHMRRGEWNRSVALLDLRLDSALRMGNAVHIASAAAQRSIARSHLRDAAGAGADLQLARAWLGAIRDSHARSRVEAELAFSEAIGTGDARIAEDLLTRSLVFYRQSKLEIFAAQTLLERARAFRRGGDLQAAYEDALDGLASLERQRESIRDLNDRASMFQSSRELFTEAIELSLLRKDEAAAFMLSERAKGRALLDRLEQIGIRTFRAPRAPESLDDLQRALAADAAIIEYRALSQHLVAFVIRHDRFEVVRLSVTSTAVGLLVDQCSAAVHQGDAAGTRRACGNVAKVVLAPLDSMLQDVRTIAVVPDGPLAALPFRALYDERQDAFLGERFAVSETPSATLAVLSARRARAIMGTRALLVGATEFDRRRFPWARTLDHVRREIDGIQRLLPEARKLLGAQATRDTIVSALPYANVAHFAGHAVANEESPLDSRFLVDAREASEDLTASAIASLHLPRTRLVYLSSCRSAEPGRRGDGIDNLALAFLAAGVPTVVASRWDLPDREAAEIAIRFHLAALEVGDPAEALRRAAPPNRQDGAELRAACSMVVSGGSPRLVRP